MEKDGKTFNHHQLSSLPMKEIYRLALSFTVTSNYLNYWCSALYYLICKEVPTLKQLIPLQGAHFPGAILIPIYEV